MERGSDPTKSKSKSKGREKRRRSFVIIIYYLEVNNNNNNNKIKKKEASSRVAPSPPLPQIFSFQKKWDVGEILKHFLLPRLCRGGFKLDFSAFYWQSPVDPPHYFHPSFEQ